MKGLQIITAVGGVMIAGLGVAMAASNPGQAEYEQYAIDQLTGYLKTNVCTQAPKIFGDFLNSQCATLIDTGKPQIKQFISQNTQRQNYIFFSIYKTDLSVGSVVPSYHFETVGAFQNFYTYEAEKR